MCAYTWLSGTPSKWCRSNLCRRVFGAFPICLLSGQTILDKPPNGIKRTMAWDQAQIG
jgi:hypothetical protein